MYKCVECGFEFEEPTYIREPHGEFLPHCPACGEMYFEDIKNFECEACLGTKYDVGEQWCEECKSATRRAMSASIVGALKEKKLPLSKGMLIIDRYQEIFDNKEILGCEVEAKHLCMAMIEIASERGCGLDTAREMAEQWVKNSPFMRFIK